MLKKRTRKTTKFQRAIVGASWEQIVAKRDQPSAVRKATRDQAAEAAKKKADKIKVPPLPVVYWWAYCGCRASVLASAPPPSSRLRRTLPLARSALPVAKS